MISYTFGSDNGNQVTADTLYSEDRGYGFLTEENRSLSELLSLPEMTNGFTVPFWLADEKFSLLTTEPDSVTLNSRECMRMLLERGLMGRTEDGSDYAKRLFPMTFLHRLTSGCNARVSVTLDVDGEPSPLPVAVFSGRRSLAWLQHVKPGETIVAQFVANTEDFIPRNHTEEVKGGLLAITLVSPHVRLRRITIEPGIYPTVAIAGDSTVTDQPADYPYLPATSYSGWGQMLQFFLGSRIAVSNHSHSGLTTESFRSEGHHRIFMRYLQPGDLALLQFGHNDQKLDHLKASGGYRQRLLEYIEELLERGVQPVLITPLGRNSWTADGEYNDLLSEYAEEVIRIGAERNVPVIDLHGYSVDLIKKLGREQAKAYFFPKDFTHTNDCGAFLMAAFIAGRLGRMNDLCKCSFSSAAGKEFFTPPTHAAAPLPPTSYRGSLPGEEVLGEIDRPEDDLTRVEALDFLIKAARFFPTNVYNDLFTDVIGHEWYAGTVQCAYSSGFLPAEMSEASEFHPEDPISYAEFIALAISAARSRQDVKTGEPGDFEKSLPTDLAWTAPYLRSAIAMGYADGKDTFDRQIHRREAADFCHRMNL
jgi:lysophospholipase L1-like esterase